MGILKLIWDIGFHQWFNHNHMDETGDMIDNPYITHM